MKLIEGTVLEETPEGTKELKEVEICIGYVKTVNIDSNIFITLKHNEKINSVKYERFGKIHHNLSSKDERYLEDLQKQLDIKNKLNNF